MPVEIEVYAPVVTEPSRVVIEKEIFWYDGFYSRMVSMRGSSLKYVYVDEVYIELGDGTKIPRSEATQKQLEDNKIKTTKRLKAEPTTFSIKVDTKKKDKDAVKKWFDSYSNYNNTDAEVVSSENGSVVFAIPKTELDGFSYSLERIGIRFKVL